MKWKTLIVILSLQNTIIVTKTQKKLLTNATISTSSSLYSWLFGSLSSSTNGLTTTAAMTTTATGATVVVAVVVVVMGSVVARVVVVAVLLWVGPRVVLTAVVAVETELGTL